MKVSQIIALASFLSFLGLAWCIVLKIVERGVLSGFYLVLFFILGLFSGALSWQGK